MKRREEGKQMLICLPLEQAVETAIEYCIKHDILKDFLLKQRAEVVKMSIFEYDEEREIELIRRDEREIGQEIGQKIGEEIGVRKERQNTQKILKEERRKAQQELDKSQENAVQSMISLCQRLGGTKEQAIEELQGNYGLTKEKAEEKVRTCWKE